MSMQCEVFKQKDEVVKCILVYSEVTLYSLYSLCILCIPCILLLMHEAVFWTEFRH